MHSNYFEDLNGQFDRQMKEVEDHYEYLKSLNQDEEKAIFYCKGLLTMQGSTIKKDRKIYILTEDMIDPRGNEVHIPKAFAQLMDDPEIDGSPKFHAQNALSMLNNYAQYINTHSIENNKYPAHRRDIHKLNPDIKLPDTPKEIFEYLEDALLERHPTEYKYFLQALGRSRGPKRTAFDKLLQLMRKSLSRNK